MDTILIILLICFIIIDIQACYFGFIKPPRTAAWLQQSSFIVLTFLLIPLLIYILFSQAGSVNRLKEHGITPHPAIQNAIGAGNGFGEYPTWVFKINRTEENALAFYKQTLSSSDWELTEETELYLRYAHEDKILTIAHRKSPSKNTLTIMMRTRP